LKIKIDGQEITLDTTACKTLKDVLDLVAREEVEEDVLLNRVFLNGAELTEEQELSPESVSSNGIRELEIHTATAQEISAESVRMASEQLSEVVEETRKTAELFRYDDESEANHRLVILIEILQKFVNLLELLKQALRLDFASISTDSKSLESHQQAMIEILGQVLAAQQNHDWISLADLLEFELVPLLETWSKVIPTLACPNDNPN